MAHVVLLGLHRLAVDVGQRVALRVGAKHLFGQRLVLLDLLGLRLDRVDEHLPKALRLDVVQTLVGRGVAEDVGDRLAELLDGNGEAVGLVVCGHFEEGIAGEGESVLFARQKVDGDGRGWERTR